MISWSSATSSLRTAARSAAVANSRLSSTVKAGTSRTWFSSRAALFSNQRNTCFAPCRVGRGFASVAGDFHEAHSKQSQWILIQVHQSGFEIVGVPPSPTRTIGSLPNCSLGASARATSSANCLGLLYFPRTKSTYGSAFSTLPASARITARPPSPINAIR